MLPACLPACLGDGEPQQAQHSRVGAQLRCAEPSEGGKKVAFCCPIYVPVAEMCRLDMWVLKKMFIYFGGWRECPVVKIQVCFPELTYQITAICKSSSGEPNTCVWPPQVLGMHTAAGTGSM